MLLLYLLIVFVHAQIRYKRIVGGERVIGAQLPFMAVVKGYSNNRNHFCSATIVSRRHVLTAAHCVSYMINKRSFIL